MKLVTLLNQMRPLIVNLQSDKELPPIHHVRINSIFLLKDKYYIAKKDHYLECRSDHKYDFK